MGGRKEDEEGTEEDMDDDAEAVAIEAKEKYGIEKRGKEEVEEPAGATGEELFMTAAVVSGVETRVDPLTGPIQAEGEVAAKLGKSGARPRALQYSGGSMICELKGEIAVGNERGGAGVAA